MQVIFEDDKVWWHTHLYIWDPYYPMLWVFCEGPPQCSGGSKYNRRGEDVYGRTTSKQQYNNWMPFSTRTKQKIQHDIKPFNHNIMIFRKEEAIRIIIQPSTKMRRLVERRTRKKRSRMVRRRMKMNLGNTRTSRWLCWTQNTKLRVRLLLLTATQMLINKEILSLRIPTSWPPTTTTWTTGFPRPLRSSANLDPCILRHTTRAPTGVVETIMFKW